MRKVLTNFENYSQSAQPVGKPDQPVIRFCFPEQQLGHFALFGSVLTDPELESSMRNVLKKFEIFSQPVQPVGELDQPVH